MSASSGPGTRAQSQSVKAMTATLEKNSHRFLDAFQPLAGYPRPIFLSPHYRNVEDDRGHESGDK